MTTRLRTVALLGALLATSPLAAQTVRRDTVTLSPVVVTATRGAPGQRTATSSATVLDGARLRAAGIRTVAEALEAVPGVVVARQGSPGGVASIFVRGGESDFVRVLVDGVPVNEPGGFLDAANLTTDDVERIEVVRGPSSVLYGSEAVSAVVQIFTRGGRRASSRTRGRAELSAGTHEALDAAVSLDGVGRLGDYAVGVARHRIGGFHPFNDRHENLTASALLRTPEARPGSAHLSLRFTDGESRYPTEYTGEVADSNSLGTERRLVAGAGLRRDLGDRLQLELLGSATEVEGVNEDAPDSPGDPDAATRFERESWRRGAGARATLRATDATSVTVGGDLEWQRTWTRFDFAGSPGEPFEGRRWSRAAYAQALGDVGARVSYAVGARFDDNELYGSHLTWRASAGAVLAGGLRLRGAVAPAFTEPTLDEASAAAAAGARLDPELARSWEVGVEQPLAAERLVLGATWFDQRFEDLIQFVGFTPDFTLRYANAARARARGVEIEGRLRLAAPVVAGAAYTWLDAEVLEAEVAGPALAPGEPLLRRPRHHASATLELRLPRASSLHLRATRVGARDDVRYTAADARRVTLPAYTTVDAGLEARIVRSAGPLGAVALTARATNLLDAEYEAVAGFASPGRVLAAGIRVGH